MHQIAEMHSRPRTRVVVVSATSDPVLLQREDVTGITREGRTFVSANGYIDLPADSFDFNKAILESQLELWEPVLIWLKNELNEDGVLVFPFSDPYRELGLLAQARKLFSYGVFFDQGLRKVSVRDYPFFGSAEFLLFKNAQVERDVRRVYVANYKGLRADESADEWQAVLHGNDGGLAPTRDPSDDMPSRRILLIAYFSGPSRTVGVQRINYWHREIPKLWAGTSVTLVTANPWGIQDPTVLQIRDLGPGCLVNEDGSVPAWGSAYLESEAHDAKSVTTLAQCWRINLEKHFDNTDDHFDVVIISGNPFSVFDFAAYAKRKWSARVVLDYRDPFSNNPRILYKPEARRWARYLEKGYNLQADLVTVVNQDCAEMVEGREDVPVAVVKNGFDEGVLPARLPAWRESDGKIHFIHTGTIYPGRSPESLINELAKGEYQFHHVGDPSLLDADRIASGVASAHGRRPYPETLELISRADCGVAFVHDNGFDTPTKLFDYIAYGIDILILTDGQFGEGAAGELVNGLDRVYWAKNTPEGVSEFLKTYVPSRAPRSSSVTERYSRMSSTRDLIGAIQGILP